MAKYPIVRPTEPETLVDAELFTDISLEEFAVTDAKWSAFKEEHASASRILPENHAWRWGRKPELADAPHGFLALRFDGELEGLLMYSLDPVPSRMPELLGRPTMYVEFIESAPWNQKEYAGDNVRFWGVGLSLLAAAVGTSREIGCGGGLVLHSLAQSERFYIRRGFRSFGLDQTEGFVYFERNAIAFEGEEMQ